MFAVQTHSWFKFHCPRWCCLAVPQLLAGLSSTSVGLGSKLTPANDDEDPQVVLVGKEGHEDQAVQVEAFHQDPVVVGGQEVEEERHHRLAANLHAGQRGAHISPPPQLRLLWLCPAQIEGHQHGENAAVP